MALFEKLFPARAEQERRERELEDLEKSKIQLQLNEAGTYYGVPSPEKEEAMRQLFEEGERGRKSQVLQQLFQGNTAGVNSTMKRNVGLENELAPQMEPRQFESPRAKFQQERGYDPSTPWAIAKEMEDLKSKGITDKYLLGLQEAEKRTRMMADATAGRQLETFKQQEKMAEEAEKRKPPTESQSKASLFANRVEQSDPIIEEQTDYVKLANPVWFTLQKDSPDWANAIRDPQFRQYDQARRNFLNAILRRESGAVISPTEFADGNRQYFPLPGDDEKTLEQKRQNRLIAINNLKSEGGKAYKSIYSNPIAVGAAFQAGKITEKQAKYILKRDFGLQD